MAISITAGQALFAGITPVIGSFLGEMFLLRVKSPGTRMTRCILSQAAFRGLDEIVEYTKPENPYATTRILKKYRTVINQPHNRRMPNPAFPENVS